MAVQANIKATSVSSSGLQNNAHVSSISSAATTINGLIQTIGTAGNLTADSKAIQHMPVRVVQAIPAGDGNLQQPQIVRIIKPDGGNRNVFIRAPLASPIKGGSVINIPSGTARLLTNPGTKLKVGDTITIPKSSLVHDATTSNLTTGQSTNVSSTPTKMISVAASPHSSVFVGSPETSNIASSRITTVIQPNTSFTQQPDHLTTISQTWSQSPLRNKRPSIFMDPSYQTSESKRRRTPNSSEKGSKGLRHFAMLVCEKVKQKVTTTYNEVADELVAEYSDAQRLNLSDQHYDQKNIRRRVYDALNVLMAMEIIYKDKKDIHWVGLPTNSAQEVQALQNEKKKREQRIQQKTLQLQELILQQIAFKNLVQRNKRLQQTQGPPPENSAIQLPFIIVNTSKKTVIDCSISNDKYEYMFNFDNTFEIHDDIEVLKRMGMAYGLEAGTCSRENLKTAQTLVPPVLKPYLEQMAGYSKDRSDGETAQAMKYTLQDAPRIVPQTNLSSFDSTAVKIEPHLALEPCFTTGHKPDADDQEVAMVTEVGQMSSNSSGITVGFTSSSRSSSSGLQMLSLTPLSSCADSESRGSTPMDAFDT
ncbi:uncharacterized protein LOC143450869 [Clavelina lepadiformis]|uniref:uncharacterized protein LOC143450869 n=1 Tax=Clavelina lepadiformis TaxID=159417 RepID=UPI0040433AE1